MKAGQLAVDHSLLFRVSFRNYAQRSHVVPGNTLLMVGEYSE